MKTIPETSFRNLYRLLRDFPKAEYHFQSAVVFEKVPKRLDKMFRRSFEHFSQYDNSGESFHERGQYGTPTESRRQSQMIADQFAVALFDRPSSGIGLEKLPFRYVDYNVSPFRTTGKAIFDSGIRATRSGRGGADLLLVSHDGTPIIGEVKAVEDATLILALIQALTYAIEFSTQNQRIRLQNSYPDRFIFPENGPFIDVQIIQVNPVVSEWNENLKALVQSLSRKLMSQQFIPTIIRRIGCMSTRFDPGVDCVYKIEFDYLRNA
jgi:hypothetical protein